MYKVIYADRATIREALQEIANEVNKSERQGWRALGGITITDQRDCDYVYAAQAMVKYEDAPKDSQDVIKVMA